MREFKLQFKQQVSSKMSNFSLFILNPKLKTTKPNKLCFTYSSASSFWFASFHSFHPWSQRRLEGETKKKVLYEVSAGLNKNY